MISRIQPLWLRRIVLAVVFAPYFVICSVAVAGEAIVGMTEEFVDTFRLAWGKR